MGFPWASAITFFAVVFFILVVSISVWLRCGVVCNFLRIRSLIASSILGGEAIGFVGGGDFFGRSRDEIVDLLKKLKVDGSECGGNLLGGLV